MNEHGGTYSYDTDPETGCARVRPACECGWEGAPWALSSADNDLEDLVMPYVDQEIAEHIERTK